jgi:hypothetical protein
MGLLDDAIREHLDLKRRRGADPTEIERAEREALGPVRRGPEELDEGEFAPALDPHEAVDYAGNGGEYADDGGDYVLEPEWEEPVAAEPAPPAPHAAAEAGEPLTLDEDPVAERRLPEYEPPPPPDPAAPPASEASDPPLPPEPPAADSEHLGPETAEYDVESGHERHSEDLLEETPEFLQDTPEHDRLWFEQRPPRDFDFDH